MPLQQHLYNGLARPVHNSIFAWECNCLPVGEYMLAQEWTRPHGQHAGLCPACAYCQHAGLWPLMAYLQHAGLCWPRVAACSEGEPMLAWDRQRKQNVLTAGYTVHSLRGHKNSKLI